MIHLKLLVLKYQCHFPLKYFVIIICQYFEQVQFLKDLVILVQHKYIALAKIHESSNKKSYV